MNSDPIRSYLFDEDADDALTSSTAIDSDRLSDPELKSAQSQTISIIPRQARHDLRNYIGQVIGYSELWLEKDQGDAAVQVALHHIHSAGKQILAIVNAHLDPLNRSPRAEPLTSLTVSTGETAGSSASRSADQLRHWRDPDRADRLDDTGAGNPDINDGLILVVDDNEANRDLLCQRLQQQGHRIVVAANGEEALDRLHEQSFDVVLLDILMPVLDGHEALRRIKADEDLRHLPVIMISALDETDTVIQCISMGADDYLSKPFDPVLLRARLGACLEKKRMRDRERRLFSQLEHNFQRLKELEALRDDLTHMIVHDLRTPLTSLLSGLQSMQLSDHMDGVQHELLEIALNGGRLLLGMINDLLNVGKMESGTLELHKRPLQAIELIEQARQQVISLVKEKGITLTSDIASGLPEFAGDEDLLVRTLVNLLGNAIKFTPSGGTISVLTYQAEVGALEVEAGESNRTGPAIMFAVRDTGKGIPHEAFERIFHKFGQVEARRAGHKLSTGLGLTFCKMVAEAHGGRIWVESEVGQGSTFFFAIPAS